MSYNGVGLQTARGSGTSGYVTSNKFHRSGSRLRREEWKDLKTLHAGAERARKPDEAILEHNRKRDIEAKLMQLEDDLEEQGVPESEIAERLRTKRAELERDAERAKTKATRKDDTHAVAQRKQEKMEDLRKAFGLSAAKASREGDAFDRELQQQLREKRRVEHEEQVRQREAQRRKEARRREKEAKRAEKEKREARRVREREARRAEKEKRALERARKRERKEKDASPSASPRRSRSRSRSPEGASPSASPRRRHDSDSDAEPDDARGGEASSPGRRGDEGRPRDDRRRPRDESRDERSPGRSSRGKKKRRRRSPSSSESSSESSSSSSSSSSSAVPSESSPLPAADAGDDPRGGVSPASASIRSYNPARRRCCTPAKSCHRLPRSAIGTPPRTSAWSSRSRDGASGFVPPGARPSRIATTAAREWRPQTSVSAAKSRGSELLPSSPSSLALLASLLSASSPLRTRARCDARFSGVRIEPSRPRSRNPSHRSARSDSSLTYSGAFAAYLDACSGFT